MQNTHKRTFHDWDSQKTKWRVPYVSLRWVATPFAALQVVLRSNVPKKKEVPPDPFLVDCYWLTYSGIFGPILG